MELFTGTSGFAYKEWKGAFYPEDIKNDQMLPYYAERFRACEINNSFYRVPAEKTLLQWREQVPAHFRFILKAPQKITHFTRLKAESREPLEYFLKVARALGEQLGPILFQLPPNMKCDVERLKNFLGYLPNDVRAAFEFRHASWFDDTVFSALREGGAALCVADTDDEQTPHIATNDSWGYLRLRRVAYETKDLKTFIAFMKQQSWQEAFVFFKHEDAATGPRLAKEFAELFAK